MHEDMYELLFSDNITVENFYSEVTKVGLSASIITVGKDGKLLVPQQFFSQIYDLRGYIIKFGVPRMQDALEAIIAREDLKELPYMHMPYHQYIKSAIGMIGASEFIYSKFDTIKWSCGLVYDYNSGYMSIYNIVDKYGIDSIFPLRIMGADFSKLSGDDIEWLIDRYGEEFIHLLPQDAREDSVDSLVEAGAAEELDHMGKIPEYNSDSE